MSPSERRAEERATIKGAMKDVLDDLRAEERRVQGRIRRAGAEAEAVARWVCRRLKYGGGGPVSNKDFKGSKFKKGGVGAVRIVWGLDGKTSKYRVYPDRGTEDQTSVEG